MQRNNTNPHTLGVIMRDIGNFDISTFDGRLVLQKTIYLLQSFGISLGYQFNWYLHGVYSPGLTRDGFKLKKFIDDMPSIDIQFADKRIQEQYDAFMEFIRDKKSEPDLLEIASSICFLHDSGFEKETVLDIVEKKKPQFKRTQCVDMWNRLESCWVVSP